MRVVNVTLKSDTPLQQGRFHGTPKLSKEGNDDYEERTWREKCHTDKDGNVIIPPQAIKACIQGGAKYCDIPIPGKGKRKYTKHFLSGIEVPNPITLPAKKDDLEKRSVMGNSQGRRQAPGSRVVKHFPTWTKGWESVVTFWILDDIIPKDVFEFVLKEAGRFMGLMVYRPENGGSHGRFSVEKIEWKEEV